MPLIAIATLSISAWGVSGTTSPKPVVVRATKAKYWRRMTEMPHRHLCQVGHRQGKPDVSEAVRIPGFKGSTEQAGGQADHQVSGQGTPQHRSIHHPLQCQATHEPDRTPEAEQAPEQDHRYGGAPQLQGG